MSSCIDNFIGVRAICDENNVVPTSGLYIEDLEGITVKRISDIEYGKHQQGLQLIQEKLRFATGLVMDDLKFVLLPHYNTNTIIEKKPIGNFSQTNYTALSGDCGIRLNKIKGDLSRMYITSVFVKNNVSLLDATVTITDGTKITPLKYNSISGKEVRIDTMYECVTDEVTVTIDSVLEPYMGELSKRSQSSGCNGCCSGNSSNSQYITAMGIHPVDGDIDDLVGVRVNTTTGCTFDKITCTILPHIKYAILYKLGIELLKEWESSDRLNWMTIHGKKWASEKIVEWETYEYPKRLETVSSGLSNFLQGIDSACFNCSGTKYKNILP